MAEERSRGARPDQKLEAGAEVGRVARLRSQFEKAGGKASNPSEYERQREALNKSARGQAALHNVSSL